MPPCATLQALRYLHRASSALVALRCFGNARAPGSTLLTSLLATSSSRVRSWAVVGGALLVRRTGNETSPAGCCGLPLRAWPGVHAVELVLQCSLLTSLVQRGVILVRYRGRCRKDVGILIDFRWILAPWGHPVPSKFTRDHAGFGGGRP